MKSALSMPSNFRRLTDLFEYLVDDQVGIIQRVYELPKTAGSPEFFHYYAQACNTNAFTHQENFMYTGGASSSRDIAMAKAIGEAVERYCAAIYSIEDFPLHSREQAPFPCIDPQEFSLYTSEQLQLPGILWEPFTDQSRVRWVPTVDLGSGETVHVPASMVYVPYFYYMGEEYENSIGAETPICQPISTGLACHCSLEEAVLSGICEMVERDAFMITWQAMVSAPQILIETCSDEVYDLVTRFERTGAKVTLLNITNDIGIHTILSVLRSESAEEPALAFAASSSLDPEEAAIKALEELAHTRRYCYLIKSKMPPLEPQPPYHENIEGQEGHLNLYSDYRNVEHADFIFDSKERIEFDELENHSTGDPRKDLHTAVKKIQAVGHRVLVADLTTPDVRQLGLHVVHAIVPGFQPLFMGYMNRSLGGKRLWEVPQKMGHKGISRDTGDNPWPHPYP